MKFDPGLYYIGDPSFILPSSELRPLFSEYMCGGFKEGVKPLICSIRVENSRVITEHYWISPLMHKEGTLYDHDGKGWGFDWGLFGVVPWKWIENQPSYETHKMNFIKPFTCSCTEDSITIGHLHFTFNPK